MIEEFADLFDKTEDQIKGLYEEIGLLSKKKPDSPINKFKLKFINKIIREANGLLKDEYVPFVDFLEFEEDDLPSASDVVLMLSQYLKSMDKFRFDNTQLRYSTYYWILDDYNEDEDESLWKETKPSTFV
jgi:hypothetical protein